MYGAFNTCRRLPEGGFYDFESKLKGSVPPAGIEAQKVAQSGVRCRFAA